MYDIAKALSLSLKDVPPDYQIDPACQEILESDLKASEKVSELVKVYFQDYPAFSLLERDLMHPSYLALYRPIRYWMLKQCGDSPVELWGLMLAAAKEWFTEKEKTKLGHAFSVRFEMEWATWWDGRDEFKPIMADYMAWRYG